MNQKQLLFWKVGLAFPDIQNRSVMKELSITTWNSTGIIWDLCSIMILKNFSSLLAIIFSTASALFFLDQPQRCMEVSLILFLPSSRVIKCKVIWRDPVFLRTILILLFFVVLFFFLLNNFTPLKMFKWKPAVTKFSSFHNFFNCNAYFSQYKAIFFCF